MTRFAWVLAAVSLMVGSGVAACGDGDSTPTTATPVPPVVLPILGPRPEVGMQARIEGQLTRDGPCLYVESAGTRTLLIFWGPPAQVSFDDASAALSVDGVVQRVGQDAAFGGGEISLVPQPDAPAFTVAPDLACETGQAFVVFTVDRPSPLTAADWTVPGPDMTPIPGTTPDTSKPFWYVPYQNQDAKLPLLDGTIAGVHISSSEDPGRLCEGATGGFGTYESTLGTPLTLYSSVTVAGLAGHEHDEVLLCDGSPVAAGTTYIVSSDPAIPRFGGAIFVYRHTGKPVASLAIPAKRWREGAIAGHDAAIASPILPDLGLGESAVVLVIDGVTTIVHGSGIPLADVLAFTEGLFK